VSGFSRTVKVVSGSSRTIAVLLFLLAASPAFGQTPSPTQTPAPAPPPEQPAPPQEAPASPAPSSERRIAYGVRFGPSFATLTSIETFAPDMIARAFEPTLNFGLFAHTELPGPLSFQPEILFAARGHRIHDKDAQPTTAPTGELKRPSATHVILIRYLEIPLLLRLSKQTRENTAFYLIFGPAFALQRNAVIRQVSDSGRKEDIDALVTGSNLSYVAGGGVQYKRWLADARVTKGMGNIAVTPLPAEVKTNAFSVLIGARF
jgi:hypothetical protein